MSEWTCPRCDTSGNPPTALCRVCNFGALALEREDGERIVSFIDLRCNQAWALRLLGADGRFWHPDVQLIFVRRLPRWAVVPNSEAQNETLVNGVAVTSETLLSEGDVVAVGRAARTIAKTPMRVRFE